MRLRSIANALKYNKNMNVLNFVIFPGTLEGKENYVEMVTALEESEQKVFAFDFYTQTTINEFCDYAKSILDKKNITKLNLFGHSLGGMLALSFAKKYPEMVEKLILSHTCLATSTSFKRFIVSPYEMLLPRLLETDESTIKSFITSARLIVEKVEDKVGGNELIDKMVQLAKAHLSPDLEKQVFLSAMQLLLDFADSECIDKHTFATWHGKAMIMRTKNDPLMSDDGGLEEIFDCVRIRNFSKTGHLTRYLQSKEVNNEILSFVSK